jgi:hypothetical protein
VRRRRVLAALASLALAAGCSSLPPLPTLPDLGFDTRPVSIDQPIDGSTRARLAYATRDNASCTAWLAAAGIGFRPVADHVQGETCQVIGAGLLQDSGGQADARLSPARPMMACPLAAAVAVWRRQSVEPAAREILGAEVRQIDHLGVYACRSVNGMAGARPSAHARAEAIDIAGLRLGNGRRVTVARDWTADTPDARFLRRIRDDACRVFGMALSPDYNALHADHLHLEVGGGGPCS